MDLWAIALTILIGWSVLSVAIILSACVVASRFSDQAETPSSNNNTPISFGLEFESAEIS